jgi:hypothetical protein
MRGSAVLTMFWSSEASAMVVNSPARLRRKARRSARPLASSLVADESGLDPVVVSPTASTPGRRGLGSAILRARGAMPHDPPLHLRRRLGHPVQHIERARLLWLAAEIFADVAPHILLADVRPLPDH